MIQHPTKGAITYHPYGYQQRLADVYHGYVHSVNLLPRQSGKCVNQHTKINIRNDKTGKTYDIPIGIYFEFIKSMQLGIAGPDVSAFEVQSM